jgi:hypothetical protein
MKGARCVRVKEKGEEQNNKRREKEKKGRKSWLPRLDCNI